MKTKQALEKNLKHLTFKLKFRSIKIRFSIKTVERRMGLKFILPTKVSYFLSVYHTRKE